jgi:hypothetical protein
VAERAIGLNIGALAALVGTVRMGLEDFGDVLLQIAEIEREGRGVGIAMRAAARLSNGFQEDSYSGAAVPGWYGPRRGSRKSGSSRRGVRS